MKAHGTPQSAGPQAIIKLRFKKILKLLRKQDMDGLLLNAAPNVSYVAGFHAPDSYAVVSQDGITIFTDFRYAADFKRRAQPPTIIKECSNSVFKEIIRHIKQRSIKTIGFESRHLTFAECQVFCDLSHKSVKWLPLKETLEPLREVKDAQELKNIKEAVAITLKTFGFIKRRLKPGLREIEVAADIERFLRLEGAQTSAFNIIVACGPNSSYPHALPTRRKMLEGETVVIDMGVEYNGYKCDLTRTFFLGRINPIVKKITEVIRQAKHKAISAIKPGVPIKKIDSIARNYIQQNGFGKNFGHALGHGVGLEAHERPAINRKNTQRIKRNSVFTVEPGIYLPGKFGVRIEDMVLVTEKGVEVLSDDIRN